MQNKGFTLIELIGVIAILGIIASIAVVSVFDLIESNNLKAWEYTKSNLETSAENYVKEQRLLCTNTQIIYDTYNYKYCVVTITDLLKNGYILKKVVNPSADADKQEVDSSRVIRVYSDNSRGLTGVYDDSQAYNIDTVAPKLDLVDPNLPQ